MSTNIGSGFSLPAVPSASSHAERPGASSLPQLPYLPPLAGAQPPLEARRVSLPDELQIRRAAARALSIRPPSANHDAPEPILRHAAPRG